MIHKWKKKIKNKIKNKIKINKNKNLSIPCQNSSQISLVFLLPPVPEINKINLVFRTDTSATFFWRGPIGSEESFSAKQIQQPTQVFSFFLSTTQYIVIKTYNYLCLYMFVYS